MSTGPSIHPQMPEPIGPNAARSKFFMDVAAAMELLALFYSLDKEDQEALIGLVRGYAAHNAQRPERTAR